MLGVVRQECRVQRGTAQYTTCECLTLKYCTYMYSHEASSFTNNLQMATVITTEGHLVC